MGDFLEETGQVLSMMIIYEEEDTHMEIPGQNIQLNGQELEEIVMVSGHKLYL